MRSKMVAHSDEVLPESLNTNFLSNVATKFQNPWVQYITMIDKT